MAKDESMKVKVINQGPWGFFMFLAFAGALGYFARGANDFGDFVWAFIQAIVWPAFMVYHGLLALGV